MTHPIRDPENYIEIIRHQARPIAPKPTGIDARLERLPGIRAVLLDIYGTMLVSGCGEVGLLATEGRAGAIAGAMVAVGIERVEAAERWVEILDTTIGRHASAARQRGIEYPEVDIVAVWQDVFRNRPLTGSRSFPSMPWEKFALEYEVRANPCWPMPHLETCLDRLCRSDRYLGIVSNAQFYTPLFFPALVNQSLEELGFDRASCFFSYQHGHAKPGDYLYRLASEHLRSLGIQARDILYVGNDMLNDMAAASRAGMRTALFAGDVRSLRLRTGDLRIVGVFPDLVLTDLLQLADCLV